MKTTPVETVKSLFQSFGAGDLPGVLGLLAEDVVWSGGKFDVDVPTHVERRGRAGAAPRFRSSSKALPASRSFIASSRAISFVTATK
jgi:ketosteroid isomerase-like protein